MGRASSPKPLLLTVSTHEEKQALPSCRFESPGPELTAFVSSIFDLTGTERQRTWSLGSVRSLWGGGEHLLAAGCPGAALLYAEGMGISAGIHASGRGASSLARSNSYGISDFYRSAHPEFCSRHCCIGSVVSALI